MTAPQVATQPVLRPPPSPDRRASYNATITEVRDVAGGLRVFRVEPDGPVDGYQAGRYLSLGLGYWEPRVEGVDDDEVPESKRNRLVSRPYSLSSPIVEQGRVHDPAADRWLEFYVALVEPAPPQPPAVLTPRLWTRRRGDRVSVGPRIVGRYTLDPVGPGDDVLMLATGTGEAPHNAMVAELARSGHEGRVTVLTTSRNRNDFGYERNHQALERLWANYRYIALSTRQPVDGIKRYVQDVLLDPDPSTWIGFDLDPDRTHVFLCGNPAMVGPAEWIDDQPVFPTDGGALEILHARGFTLDRKGGPAGNVHFEEYW